MINTKTILTVAIGTILALYVLSLAGVVSMNVSIKR